MLLDGSVGTRREGAEAHAGGNERKKGWGGKERDFSKVSLL